MPTEWLSMMSKMAIAQKASPVGAYNEHKPPPRRVLPAATVSSWTIRTLRKLITLTAARSPRCAASSAAAQHRMIVSTGPAVGFNNLRRHQLQVAEANMGSEAVMVGPRYARCG